MVEQIIEGFGPVRQLGHVVADIDESIAEWRNKGVGPWMLFRRVHLKAEYLGQASVPIIDVALGYQGAIQIELIRQHNDAASPYLETVQRGEFGLHHHACLCDDINADVERAQAMGMQMVCDINMMGSRYVYLKNGDDYLEFLPNSLMMRGMFRQGMAACARWGQGDSLLELNLDNVMSLLKSIPSAAGAWWQQQYGAS